MDKPEPKAPPRDSLGAAFYPGKESWKREQGNRYTPEELRAMQKNWEIELINPDRPEVRDAD